MRIVLLQPDADAAASMTEDFGDAGYEVLRAGRDADDTMERLGDTRPYAIVICLDREPGTALNWASSLASRRQMRNAPLLFAGGTEEALKTAEEAHPRASFTRMEALLTSLASIRR